MKKLLLIAAALLLCVCAKAQIGVIAGVTSTESSIKSASLNAESITQYHLGLAMRFPMGAFALQPALIYNIKGQQLGAIKDGNDFSADFKTGFLELPVQFQLGFKLLGFRPFVFAEPFVGYAITNETKEELAYVEGTREPRVPVKSKTDWDNVKNRIEYGVGLGAGIDLLNHMQISLRYFWNMGPLYNDNAIRTSISGIETKVTQTKCSGIMVSAALFF